MKHSTLFVAVGLATLGSSALAQQVGPKTGWMKPTDPRASVQQPAGPLNGSQNTMFVTQQVGGSDSCATPDVLVGTGSFAFDNSLASTGPQGQTEAACLLFGNTAVLNDVWFRWTSTFNGVARITTCGIGNGIDTKLAIYLGTGCPAGAALGGNDDACATFESTVDLTVVLGQSYMIQLGLYPGNNPPAVPGMGLLSINPITPPPEDNCATPVVIVGPGTYPDNNTTATTGTQGQTETACNLFANTTVRADVWYRWTSTFTGTARLDTCGSGAGIDTKIAVYAGAGRPTAAAIDCDDDACPTFESTVVFPVVNGLQYTFQIGLYPGAAPPAVPGSGTFTIQPPCTPPVGTPFCFGDGSPVACPCGNSGAAGNGCASSSVAAGANIAATGSASIATDTLLLQGSGMPNSSALYFQGTGQQNGGLGSLFGDGKRCASGTVIRLKTVTNVLGASQYPGGGDPCVSVRGVVLAPGIRTYQAWYRNAAAFCTTSTFNLSNGLEINWQL